MRYALPSLALLSIIPSTLGAPAPVAESVAVPEATPAPSLENAAVGLEERQILGGLLGGVLSGVDGIVAGLIGDVVSAAKAQKPDAVNSALVKIVAPNRPTNVADAHIRASKIWANPTGRTDFYPAIATQIAAGLEPVLDGTLNAALVGGLPVGENSINNNNPKPPTTIYPRKIPGDAPYSVSEDALRKAIYIPPSFTYGKVRPIIMVPGTGSYGGQVFRDNLRKLLTGSSYADPVWLNIPGAMLRDAQVNAEYIAYAINYISAVCKTNKNQVAVTTWSQGGLDAQWALKYWPSTRSVVTDFLPVSADFRGTVLANVLCLAPNSELMLVPCQAAIIQQEATSNFVRSLRQRGGDSAYVPTTSFYSGFFDEVVEPQQGTSASAYMNDANKIGVSNNEVQRVCAGRLGGGFYGHAGMLAHPLTYALIVDALTHTGPGNLGRIDVASVCNNIIAPGLDLDDYLATLGLIPIAGVTLLAGLPRIFQEPQLMSYADR